FHVVGCDDRGTIMLRQKWSRGQVEARLANLPPSLIGMEACVGAHHLSRKLRTRCSAYAREVRAPVFEGTEERLPRCGGRRRGGAAPDDEVRPDQDRRAARLAGAPPRAGAFGQSAHWQSSIRSAPSFSSVALPCVRACASCALSYRAFSPRPVMPCRLACCAPSRSWPVTGAGSMSASRDYPARSKHWRGKIRAASG